MNKERAQRIGEYKQNLQRISNPVSAATSSALLTGEVNIGLTEAVENLQLQITESVKELGGTMSQSVQELITSYAQLADSSDKNARAMVRLTWALVFVGTVQTITTIVPLLWHRG